MLRPWTVLILFGLISAQSGSGSGDFTVDAEQCLICEFVGVANDEYDALYMLAGVNATDDALPWTAEPSGIADLLEPCLHGALSEAFDEAIVNGHVSHDTTDSSFCTASFFLFHAMDINRWVYGIKRGIGSTALNGLADLTHYEGIKSFTVSVARENNEEVGMVPSMREVNYKHEDGSTYGINARYTLRGAFKQFFNQSEDVLDESFQVFAMDGREIIPGEFLT